MAIVHQLAQSLNLVLVGSIFVIACCFELVHALGFPEDMLCPFVEVEVRVLRLNFIYMRHMFD